VKTPLNTANCMMIIRLKIHLKIDGKILYFEVKNKSEMGPKRKLNGHWAK
jgi:hypothetical protein